MSSTLSEAELGILLQHDSATDARPDGGDRQKGAPTVMRFRRIGLVLAVAFAAALVIFANVTPVQRVPGTKSMLAGAAKLVMSQKPADGCKEGLRFALKSGWTISFFDSLGKGKGSKDERDVDTLYNMFVDTDTFNIAIEKDEGKSCGKEAKSVVWLYPSTAADDTGAFGLGDGECSRLEYFVEAEDVECVQVYHVESAAEAVSVLQKYHDDGTILHAVIGGHGSDQVNQGYLYWIGTNLAAGNEDFLHLLRVLKEKLASVGATVFLDSCFAGINGVAKQASVVIPDAWVFGGVVSLTSDIKLHDNMVVGDDGPARIVSEFAFDKVLDASDRDHALGYYQGERLLAFHGGESKGSVTQWLYPSKNNKIIRVGAKVVSASPIGAYRPIGAVWQDEGDKYVPQEGELGVFQTLPANLHGTVLDVDIAGNVPATGNAFILWDIPESWGEETGGAGQTLGQYVVRPDDFDKLVVKG